MKNILIPTDFSENAQIAANFAVDLFCGLPVELNLYHFYGLHHTTGGMLISIDDILQRDAETSMKKEVERMKQYCSGDKVIHSKTLNGKLTEFIGEIVRNNDIDMIVMGTQGSSGFSKELFGSNTTAVLNAVNIPVLVVPYNSTVHKDETPKLAFATDFKTFRSSDQMQTFMDLMKQKHDNLSVQAVYVSDSYGSMDPKDKEFCENLLGDSLKGFSNIPDKNIHQGLMKYLDDDQPDILLMVHRKNSFIDRLLRTSLSTKMALKSGTPLLVFKD